MDASLSAFVKGVEGAEDGDLIIAMDDLCALSAG